MKNRPVIIPVEPFDPRQLANAALELTENGTEWEFDWLTPQQSDELIPWLRELGIMQ